MEIPEGPEWWLYPVADTDTIDVVEMQIMVLKYQVDLLMADQEKLLDMMEAAEFN